MHVRTRSTSAAFTLVELLVVVAIIAAVAAILFPVFAGVRERACESTCISNLRQIGLAFRMYTADYDDHRPDRLYRLLPLYVTAPALLVCDSDPTGDYGFLNSGIVTEPGPWPYPQSYNYYLLGNEEWSVLEEGGSRYGYVIDWNHAEAARHVAPIPGLRAPIRVGRALRLQMDGHVVTRYIDPTEWRPAGAEDTCGMWWYSLTYNPGEPTPSCQTLR